MKKINIEDVINKQNVESVSHYKIFEFLNENFDLKKNLFDLFVEDNQIVKLIDKSNMILYFKYDIKKNEVLFNENLEELQK